MSRAFVKESDGLDDLPELPVSPERNLVTEKGLRQINARVEHLRQKLATLPPEARAERALVSRDLRYWNSRQQSAEPVPLQADISRIVFGHCITLNPEKGLPRTYCIVGLDDADPGAGRLSYLSPLARALIGRQVGDTVQVGLQEMEITAITSAMD